MSPWGSEMNLTREQLAKFLPDPRTIKQFENLINMVSGLEPDTLDMLSLLAGGADSKANEALAQLTRIADRLEIISNSLEALETAPTQKNDTFLTGDYLDFPVNGPHVSQERRLQWNADDGTLDVGLFGGEVLQVGQETLYYAKNVSGGSIAKGTPVMFAGSVGASGKLTFTKAVADGTSPASYMMGVACHDVDNNGFGYVSQFGLVRGFDTTGTPYGEIWGDGTLLYFDSTTPGAWTAAQPPAPAIKTPAAVVVHAASGGSGSIMVRLSINESIGDLRDVSAISPSDGAVLIFDTATNRWNARQLTSSVNLNIAKSGTTLNFDTAGATGSFVAGTKTVTVSNGIITSIV